MSPEVFRNALILAGPTCSGKTALALTLAERLGAEIVAMDSMTLYRGMNIGTAKPSAEERARVRHHMIDVLDPWESGSVAWWLQGASECCREIEGRGKRAMHVGGTPLYLKAALRGLFDGPGSDPGLRKRLQREAEDVGSGELHTRLTALDPGTAARLHPNDVRRVIRALEVHELTGKTMSGWQQQWRPGPEDSRNGEPGTATCVWLDIPRAELYTRIDERVMRMMDEGLVAEVQGLRAGPRPLSREAAQSLGYKEVCAHLDGETSLDETISLVQTRTRRFAKRQLTWFRHLPECRRASADLTIALWERTIAATGDSRLA